MGAIFDWDQANQRLSYPFRDKQQEGIHELFTDAVVYHNLYRDKAQDVRIHYYRLEPAASIELRFIDGTVLAYLTDGAPGVNYQTATLGSYTLHEWQYSTVNGSGYTNVDVVIRLVILTARMADLPTEGYPVDGVLLSSLINPEAKRVRRLFVKRALSGEIDLVTHDKVRFEAGNNLEFVLDQPVTQEVTTRQPTTIIVNAAAGLGLGPELRCDVVEGIKSINKVLPDSRGDFKLEGSPCSWFERPANNPRSPVHPNTDLRMDPSNAQWPYDAPTMSGPGLIVHQDCDACCSCDDYVNAYRAMLEWWQRAQAIATRIRDLQLLYNNMCELINAGGGKIPRGVNCSLFIMARPDFHLAFSFLVYNNSDAAIGSAEVYVDIDQPNAYIDYIGKSGYLDFGGSSHFQVDPLITNGGTYTRYKVVLAGLDQGKFARFSLNLRFNEAMPNRAAAVVTGTAKATWSTGSTEDLQRMQILPPTVKS